MSCSEEWERFLNSKELSYLGRKNQWSLEKFSTESSKKMLEKRLSSSGRSLCQVFDENAIAPLHALSNSNPRDILSNAENACRFAFKQNVEKIDANFLQKQYKETLKTAYDNFLKSKCKATPSFKDGLKSIYWFFVDIDRRNLERNFGVDILSQMVDHEVRKESSIYRYSPAIGFVAKISTKQENGNSIEYYVLKDDVKKLLKNEWNVVKKLLN